MSESGRAGIGAVWLALSAAETDSTRPPLSESSPDQATCQATYSAPGSDSVTAAYGGDSNYAASASGPVSETISQDQTTTSLAASGPRSM